jgi:hypothetical protein
MDKKNFKKILLPIIIILAGVVVVWGILTSNLSLVKTHNRSQTYTLTADIKDELSSVDIEANDVDGVIEYSVKYTARKLSFAAKNDLSRGNANCVGYARFCASVANYLMRRNAIRGKARPVVGTVLFGDSDLCKILSSLMPNRRLKNFTKDHDFVEFDFGSDVVYVDPNIYDYIGSMCRTSGNKR